MDALKNFAYTKVLTPPSPPSSGTALIVEDGSVFPAPPFSVTVWPAGTLALASNAEILRVTAIVGASLEVLRGQEGSAARSILAGDQIAATITAKVLTDTTSVGAAGAVQSADGAGGFTGDADTFGITPGLGVNIGSATTPVPLIAPGIHGTPNIAVQQVIEADIENLVLASAGIMVFGITQPTGPYIDAVTTRGSWASPEASHAEDWPFYLETFATDGTEGDPAPWTQVGSWRWIVDKTPTAGAVPGRLETWLANVAGTLVKIMTLDSTGTVTIHTGLVNLGTLLIEDPHVAGQLWNDQGFVKVGNINAVIDGGAP